jgi:hypothetical protein
MLNLLKNLAGMSTPPNDSPSLQTGDKALPPMKKGLALICYNNVDYFSRVLRSILDQKINGKPFSELYDLYIFQDGLQDRHLTTSSDEHAKVTELAIRTVGKDHFFLQPQNLGIALHYDFAERFLYEKNDYEFAVFCEHDMILGRGYLHELNKLADKFRGDERIGMMSMHSKKHLTSQEEQKLNYNQYLTMTHSWGFGMYRSTWQEMQPTVTEYLNLISGWPYHQRSHVVIAQWMKSKGFKAVASSQDMIKISILAELKKIRISLFPNFGFYIGAIGTHFTQAIYDEKKYGESIVYQEELPECPDLDSETYQNLLELSERNLLQKTLDPVPASSPITPADSGEKMIPRNLSSNQVVAEDVVAAYKLFLDRMPENLDVINVRVGASSQQLFNSFLTSQEFLDRKECWPAVIKAAQTIVEMNKKHDK